MNKTFKEFLAEMDDMEPSRYSSTSRKSPQYRVGDPSGDFAFVQDENDFEVSRNEKFSKYTRALGDPAYSAYAEAIVSNNLATKNPYFPRIRTIRTNYNETDSYILEKLIPFNSVNEDSYDLILAAGKKMFNNFEADVTERMKHLSVTQDDHTLKFKVTRGAIVHYIRYAIEDKETNLIKDKLLLQAITTIIDIKEKGGFSTDIADRNIMWRRTPIGIQLVITDPLV